MMNGNKIILDLCGGTGAWSRPYKEAGYDVRVITLPEYDVLTYEPPDNVYGILAAPPCTEFSIAKTTAPRDLKKGMETIRACMEIIWRCQTYGKLKFWALENPKGLLVRFLGHPAFKFEQWQFGGKIEKPTYIWGYFKPPKPSVAQKPSIEKFRNKVNYNNNSKEYASPVCPDEYNEYISQFHGKDKIAALRAITPTGFAQAFFKTNK